MFRIFLAMAIVAMAISAVEAQSDPAAIRTGLMKQNDQHRRALRQMVRGEAPYDAAKVNAAFEQWTDTAKKLPDLFPDDAKTGGGNRAQPAIWENKVDFNSKIADFAKVLNEYEAKANNLDELKIAYAAVDKSCDNCHEKSRKPPQRDR